ncbi:hypothetical protein C1I95_05700 [Micromonospora craterilacus]|uniref:Uncharacterized protein n=1 Tax=Micromonospora craterilacus TaxID=1655439 RepID=A0A2W2EDL6_9ACTN|nr:hypothetical protein [Micromonospora craterilacus]PZG22312.1 hypothetical protein C1I95_05700 [Micromonospora craterilacus]
MTPANAITTDKIAANAITGKTITGSHISGSILIAGTQNEIVIDDAGFAMTNPANDGQFVHVRYLGGESGVGLALNPGRPHGPSAGKYSAEATITAEQVGDFTTDPSGRHAPTLRLLSPRVTQDPAPPSGRRMSAILMRRAPRAHSRPKAPDSGGCRSPGLSALHAPPSDG